nr:hypothetical protein Iba_chr09aCG5100 [Ipomoea batatas]
MFVERSENPDDAASANNGCYYLPDSTAHCRMGMDNRSIGSWLLELSGVQALGVNIIDEEQSKAPLSVYVELTSWRQKLASSISSAIILHHL